MKVDRDVILNSPYELSGKQKEAVLSESKYIKVVAGAGAGKTETLTRRLLYLLAVKEVPPSSIVAFTFTEKAAESMKSRLYQRIESLGLDDLLKHFGELYIGTIHGFYLRLLQERFDYSDYGVLDDNQEMAFLLRYGYTMGLNQKKYGPYSLSCSQFLDTLSVVYGENIDRAELEEKEPSFYGKLLKYEKYLDRNRRLTFSFMEYLATSKVRSDPDAISYIKHLIIDEFQDINYSQFQLIKLIGQNSNLFIVGDPRQSVYQWRGSNEKFFEEFSNVFNGAKEVSIRENRRSGESIINLSNSISESFENINYKGMFSTRGVEGNSVLITFDEPENEAEKIADEIITAHSNGARFSDFGVLFRSVNTSAQPLIDQLKEKRVPYLVGGKMGLFKRDEAQALGRMFSWLHDEGFWQENPYNRKEKTLGEELLNTGLKYWRSAVDYELDPEMENQLREWKDLVLNDKFTDYKEILSEILIILGFKNLDPEEPYDAAIMANIGRFSSLLGDFESANRYGGKQEKWNIRSELKSLFWYLNTYATKAYEELASDDISSVDAVNIMTIHQAKGLEWPTVFLPSMVTSRFPSSNTGKKRVWRINEELFDYKRYEGSVEDEKRLFYVSTTRARDNLIISKFASMNGRARSESQFLQLINLEEEEGSQFSLTAHESVSKENDDIVVFSAKELIEYRRCPFHYRLSAQWMYNQGISIFMGYGEMIHSCLQKAGELIKQYNKEPLEAIREAFDSKYFLPFADEEFMRERRETVMKQLSDFVVKNKNDMLHIEEAETRIEFPIQKSTVTGRVDVILNDGESLEVRDYKTSDKVISKEDSTLQVQLYSLGLSYLGKRISKGSIANIEQTSIDPVGVTYADLEASKETAQKLITLIKSHQFAGKPGEFCKICEYKGICKYR